MADKDVGEYKGPGLIDVQAIAARLVDIRDKQRQGFRREKPGVEAVEAELGTAMPAVGDQAGIHASVYQGFVDKTQLLGEIRKWLPLVAKLHEVLEESQIFYEDSREGDIARIADAVESAASQSAKSNLLSHFDKTLSYRSQYAEKAAATRRKNEEGQGESGANEPPK